MLRPLTTISLSAKIIDNLHKNGYYYVEDIDKNPEIVEKYVNSEMLKKSLKPSLILSSLDHWQVELQYQKLKTSSESLNHILDGGFQCGTITELCGVQGSGKTQICFQACIGVQLPENIGGLEGQSLYIDTRNAFSCQRIKADNSIAGLARSLNCPVLSYDSDFYIYGVKYVPINTLNPNVIKVKEGYVRRCKIYKTEKLYDRFKGLTQMSLPLASILLGNDYINHKEFKYFFKMVLLKHTNKTTEQYKIGKVFQWLSNYTLNDALKNIIKYLPHHRKKQIIYNIESIINGYLNIPTYILKAFGFDGKFINEVQNNNTIFKYSYEEEDEEDNEEEKELLTTVEPESQFASSVPDWFAKNLSKGRYPPCFINILTHKIYILTLQSEEWSLPSAHNISFPIIQKISSLLLTLDNQSNDNNEESVVTLVTRQQQTVVYENLIIPKSCISLEDLHHQTYGQRKKMIDDILGIQDNTLEDLPPTWRLYVGTILYWIQQDCLPVKTEIHVNCLLLSMMIEIIDDKIGFCRSKEKFEKRYANDLAQILAETKLDHSAESHSTQVKSLINSVSTNNCISALPFFLEHYGLDKKIQINPDKFDRQIVHVFSQFQSLLRHIVYLNELLGRIYFPSDPSKFFNGMLLYNLYSNLKTRESIDDYICTRLRNSPLILQIFNLLKYKVFEILNTKTCHLHEEETISRRKRKKKKNKSKAKNDSSNNDHKLKCDNEDIENNDLNSFYYDPNNRYASLTYFIQGFRKLHPKLALLTEKILKNIFISSPKSFEDFSNTIAQLKKILKYSKNVLIRVIIIDSLSFLICSTDDPSTRFKNYVQTLDNLQDMASKYNLTVIVVNELVTQCDVNNEVTFVSAGGQNVANRCQKRLMLARISGSKFAARILKSSVMSQVTVPFYITTDGLSDEI